MSNGGASGGASGAPLGSITIFSLVFASLSGPQLNVALPVTNAGTSPSSCTSTTYGSCTVNDCVAPTPTPTPTPTMRLSAGTIAVDSDAANIHVSAIPDANGNYSQAPNSGTTTFRGGETFTVTGSGAAIPAFSSTATYPLLLLVTDPAPSTSAGGGVTAYVTVPRTAPATLTWQRGASAVGFVVQTNGSIASGSHGISASCYFDSQLGSATIAEEVLSAFPSGTEFLLLTAGLSTVRAGTQGINIWAAGEAITADKKASVKLKLQ